MCQNGQGTDVFCKPSVFVSALQISIVGGGRGAMDCQNWNLV